MGADVSQSASSQMGAMVWGCVKCARTTKTCCQTREILITAGDIERIQETTGATDFWERTRPNDPSYLDQDDDPNWLAWGFDANGTRQTLRRRPDGDCVFLGSHGCKLSTERRPLVCRLYPYTYTERGIDGVSDECPSHVTPPGETILRILDMRLADAVRWQRQLYAELRSKKRCDQSGPDLRPAV